MTAPRKRPLFLYVLKKPSVGIALCIVILFSALLLFSCETRLSAVKEESRTHPSAGTVRYSIIYIINGEGSNLYHDEEGRALFADIQMLKQAGEIARTAPETEVFIFYLKPTGLHRARGKLYYYRKRLLKKSVMRYTVNSGMSDAVSSLLEFYKKHSLRYREPGANSRWRSFFFYFGHEIQGGENPVAPGTAGLFTADDLADALCRLNTCFGVDGYGFDLVIVSACNSGTPGIIGRIAPFTRYIIASPGTLYLAHISTESFKYVREIEKTGMYRFALRASRYAFERLTRMTNTAVTVALYDTTKIAPNIATVEALCNPEKRQNTGGAAQGITVFYRPPLFGRGKEKTEHSGWEGIR